MKVKYTFCGGFLFSNIVGQAFTMIYDTYWDKNCRAVGGFYYYCTYLRFLSTSVSTSSELKNKCRYVFN